jgi:hypothetical protein
MNRTCIEVGIQRLYNVDGLVHWQRCGINPAACFTMVASAAIFANAAAANSYRASLDRVCLSKQ